MAPDELARMAEQARYRPSPYHKAAPAGDGTLAAKPRPDKTLCDGLTSSQCPNGPALLKSGFQSGMVSRRQRGGWPQNVWAVGSDGTVYEAQLTNAGLGEYHGYPLAKANGFARFIAEEWNRRT